MAFSAEAEGGSQHESLHDSIHVNVKNVRLQKMNIELALLYDCYKQT